MNLFKHTLHGAGSLLPLSLLTKTSGIRLLLPYAHVVSDEHLPHIKALYQYKNKKQFISDLDWLLTHYTPIHPEEIAKSILSGHPLPKKKFLFSFDDGFREMHDVVAPILFQKAVPAIFFINPAFIDNKELFYRCKLSLVLEKARKNQQLINQLAHHLGSDKKDWEKLRTAVLAIQYPHRGKADELGKIAEIDFDEFLRKEKPFLNTSQLISLGEKGFVLGGHSMDHPNYKFLDLKDQINQTLDSIRFLEQFQKTGSSYFAFPHEDQPVTTEFFHQTGNNVSVFFGTQNGRAEPHHPVLHRFNAENPSFSIPGLAKTVLLYNSFLRLTGKRKLHRKP